MPYSSGPNITRTGLVFAYDTGDQSNSWIGAPTTNLVNPSWSSWSVDGSGQGNIGTRTIISPYYCQIVDSNSNTRQYIYAYGISANTTYTFSVQYRKLSGTPTLRFQIQAYNGGSYISTMTFATTAQLGIADIYGWQTAYITLTTPANTDRVLWFMQDGDDYTTYTHAFELKNVQLELGSVATTFTPTSRSTTQGLLDISGNNNTITLVNMTYGANNALSFDGTDDYISRGNFGSIGNSYSIDCVFYSTAVQSYRNVYDMNYSTYNPNTGNVGPRLEQFSAGSYNFIWSGNTSNNNLYQFTSQTSLLPNRYYHSVFTMNGGIVNAYKNGVITDSNVASPQGYVTTFGDVNIGRGFILDPSRYFAGLVPVFKIYNTALSAQQVLQNYNSYKTRFNIT